MARKTVEDLNENVGAILTGVDLTVVPDLYGSYQRAVATTIQKADIPEATIRQNIMLYSGVTYYPPDGRMFGTALIDVRPQGAPQPTGQVSKRPISDFNQLTRRMPWGYTVTFEYRDGDPIMGIIQGKTIPQVTLSSMSSTTGWTAGDSASGLAADSTVYYQPSASLRFNLAANGADGTLSTTLTNSIDMTSYLGVGVSFLAAYFPSASAITSVTLRLGSSAGNYYTVTVTQGFLGAFYSNDWQLIAFDLANATTTGSPVITAIAYIDIITSYSSTSILSNVRYGSLWCSLPSAHEMLFYSAAAFRNGSSGPFQVAITANEDEIIFRDAAYNIYVQEAAREVAKNQGAGVGGATISEIDKVLGGTPEAIGLYEQFRGDNPSEELRSVGNWYSDSYMDGWAGGADD